MHEDTECDNWNAITKIEIKIEENENNENSKFLFQECVFLIFKIFPRDFQNTPIILKQC